MTLPARGSTCAHLQCFDLESFLRGAGVDSAGALWRCPVCNHHTPLEGLEVDQFTWAILQTNRFAEVDVVAVDARAWVKPVPPQSVLQNMQGRIKTENPSDTSFSNMSPLSPSSLKTPNLALWEIPSSNRSPALYAPPDIQSEFLLHSIT